MAAAGAAPILEKGNREVLLRGDCFGFHGQADGACGRCTYSKAEWCTYPSPSFEAHGELLRRVAFLAPWVGFDEASTAQRATVSTPFQRRSSRTAACQCAAQHSPTPPSPPQSRARLPQIAQTAYDRRVCVAVQLPPPAGAVDAQAEAPGPMVGRGLGANDKVRDPLENRP